MTMHALQEAISQGQHLQCLMEYVIQGWPESKNQLLQGIRTFGMFRGGMAVINWIFIKGRHIIILEALQQQVLKSYILITWALKKHLGM